MNSIQMSSVILMVNGGMFKSNQLLTKYRSDDAMTISIFDNYWEKVAVSLEGAPSKTKAIQLSKTPRRFQGVDVVTELSNALVCRGWKSQVGTNWNWSADAKYITTSPEVVLERKIVEAGNGLWARQMSTSSGIQGQWLNKRRAIDLVRANGNDSYTFIELKVESDNPLYAIFELLGYALAYMHARNNGWKGTGTYNVMQAKIIELVVLAPNKPENWYEYKTRGAKSECLLFKLGWLIEELNKGLDTLTKGKVRMQISLKEFDFSKGATADTAKSIISLKW